MDHQSDIAIVVDKDGVRGTVERTEASHEKKPEVRVRFGRDKEALIPADLLVLQEDGGYYLPASLSELQHHRGDIVRDRQGEDVVIPVISEEIHVQKHTVEKGKVLFRKVVHEREELVDVPLIEEEVEVKRVSINRVVDGPLSIRHEGDTMVVPVVKEILVIEKQLMLTEELHITKKEKETQRSERVTLRSEEIVTERVDPQE